MFHSRVGRFCLFLIPAILLLAAPPANACSCARTPTVLDSYDRSDVVVIVRAVSVEKAEPEKTAPKGMMSNSEIT